MDAQSILHLPFEGDRPVLPEIRGAICDGFLQRIHRRGKKWVIAVDRDDEPRQILDSDEFIRDASTPTGTVTARSWPETAA